MQNNKTTYTDLEDWKEIKGKLIKKSWEKSTTSYCAGGSEHYLLEIMDDELVLQFDQDLEAKLNNLAGKNVLIIAKKQEKKIPTPIYGSAPMILDRNFKPLPYFLCITYKIKDIQEM